MDVYISTQEHHAAFMHALLKRELRILRGKGMRVAFRERPPGVFRCRVNAPRLFGRRDRRGFRQAIANAVTVFVIQEWDYYVGRRLLISTGWTNDRDWELVRARLKEDRSLFEGYRHECMHRLVSYLEDNIRLDVDGFVNFRMPDYIDYVGKAAGRILDDLLLEQENREFIGVLRQFVERREEPMDLVHVVMMSGNRFQIYDRSMQVVAKSVDSAPGAGDDEVRQEDLLISALVTLAPRQVTLHGKCMAATYNTLTEVFPGALRRCAGCRYCPARNQAQRHNEPT